jgi:hypothetical protein
LLSAQLDQQGILLPGVSVECNDPITLTSDLDLILSNFSFTDQNSNACGGNISYVVGSAVIANPITICNEILTINFTYDCDGTFTSASVLVQSTDTTPPIVDIRSSANIYNCDDISGIVTELEQLLLFGVTDNCSVPALEDFVFVEDLDDPSTWTYNIFGCIGTVEFNVEYSDLCVNSTGMFTVSVDIYDTLPPFVIGLDGEEAPQSGTSISVPCDDLLFPYDIEVMDNCTDEVQVDISVEEIGTDEVEWEYILEDDCGNRSQYTLMAIKRTTATTEAPIAAKPSLFPTLVSDRLFFSEEKIASYKLFDQEGRLIASGHQSASIDVLSLKTGIYVAQFIYEGEMYVQRFIKN